MTGQQVRLHAATHLPGGQDPIEDDDNLIWPTPPFHFNLGDIDSDIPGGAGTIVIDSTRSYNYRLVHSGAITKLALVQLLPLAPGAYEVTMNTQVGSGYGSVDLYVAGAYPFSRFPIAPIVSSTDWLLVSSHDFSTAPSGTPYVGSPAYRPYTQRPQDIAYATAGYNGTGSIAVWTVDFTATDDGLKNLYKKSTAIDTSGNLNGGAGYYWVRFDLTGTFELSELLVLF